MVPVFGASLILTAKNNTSFLSNNPLFQYIGSISYSWYLWHWPIYVYVVRYQLEGSKKNLLLALAVSWIFAHISYRFIEVPSRKLLRHQSKAISFSLILMPVLAFMIFPWYVKLHQGLVTPLSIQLVKITNESLDKNPRESECQVLNRADPTKPSECTYGGKKLGVILVGDSHASAIALALQKALPDKNLHVLDWSISSCPASLKYKGDSELYTRCVISNAVFLEKNKHLPKDVPLLMVNYSNRVDRMEFACLLAKERPVYLLKPTPQFFANVPTIMAQNIMRKKWQYRLKTSITENYNQYEKEHLIQLDETVKKCGVKLLETLPYFCKNGYCYGDKDGIPLYYDDNHLSLYGADLLIPEFKKIFLHTA